MGKQTKSRVVENSSSPRISQRDASVGLQVGPSYRSFFFHLITPRCSQTIHGRFERASSYFILAYVYIWSSHVGRCKFVTDMVAGILGDAIREARITSCGAFVS